MPRRVQQQLREVPQFTEADTGSPVPGEVHATRAERLRGGSTPHAAAPALQGNHDPEWTQATALVITDRGNVALREVDGRLQDVIYGAIQKITETVAFHDAFPDANALHKEAFLRERVMQAAEELEDEEILARCHLDRRWFKFLKSLVSIFCLELELPALTSILG